MAHATGRLLEIAKLFSRLGCLAFGGPAAHIAMLEDEVVERRRWLDRQHFLDLIGATQLIPGPNSTEMVLHVGYERAGLRGLLVAGACFIGPAALLTGLLAWAYTRWGLLPSVDPLLAGLRPAVMAIILGALLKLGKKALGSAPGTAAPVILALGVASAVLAGVPELTALAAGGLVGTALFFALRRPQGPSNPEYSGGGGAPSAESDSPAQGTGGPTAAAVGPAARG
ncbi:MAG: chromate transporter, partial [Acidobacteriota bacterium]